MKQRRFNTSSREPMEDHAIPVSLLCAKLGEDFELFSDRIDDAIDYENLIHGLVSIHDAEAVAFS